MSKYDSNQESPPLETLKKLAIVLNVSLDYLVGLEKKQSIPLNKLSEDQKTLVKLILEELQDTRGHHKGGLTLRQQDILNKLLVEFNESK